MKYDAVVLNSGGMDSYLAWWYLRKQNPSINVANLFVDLEQPYLHKETVAFNSLRNLPGFNPHTAEGLSLADHLTPSGIIPNRNAHLVLAGATLSNYIVLGVLADEINSDKSPEFMEAMETVLNISNRGQYWNDGNGEIFRVWSPIRAYTKSELLASYLADDGSVTDVLKTVSCYDAEFGHCGACPSCFKRWVALRNNNLHTSMFRSDPAAWGKEQGILKKCHDGTYGRDRAQEILSAYATINPVTGA